MSARLISVEWDQAQVRRKQSESMLPSSTSRGSTCQAADCMVALFETHATIVAHENDGSGQASELFCAAALL